MSDQVLLFYGSDEDLAQLSKTLLAAGFREREEGPIQASESLIPHSIAFIAGVGIGKCIRTYLQTRGKRMVSRYVSPGEEKITIRGDFSADEIERLLSIPYNLDIEDEEKAQSGKGG
jgi:hypothetical protein